MQISPTSIRKRLMLYIGALVGTVVATTAIGVFTLSAVDRAEHEMDQASKARIQLLRTLTDHVSEFRIAELQRALADDEEARAEAEANEHSAQIDILSG